MPVRIAHCRDASRLAQTTPSEADSVLTPTGPGNSRQKPMPDTPGLTSASEEDPDSPITQPPAPHTDPTSSPHPQSSPRLAL